MCYINISFTSSSSHEESLAGLSGCDGEVGTTVSAEVDSVVPLVARDGDVEGAPFELEPRML